MAFESLARRRFVLLTTYRRDGTPVPTPVWAVIHDGRAYIVSRGPGKVKRIRGNPAVELTPSSARGRPCGPTEPGTALIVPAGMPDAVRRAFGRKYGPLPALGRGAARILGKDLVVIEVSPEPPAEAKTTSIPGTEHKTAGRVDES